MLSDVMDLGYSRQWVMVTGLAKDDGLICRCKLITKEEIRWRFC